MLWEPCIGGNDSVCNDLVDYEMARRRLDWSNHNNLRFRKRVGANSPLKSGTWEISPEDIPSQSWHTDHDSSSPQPHSNQHFFIFPFLVSHSFYFLHYGTVLHDWRAGENFVNDKRETEIFRSLGSTEVLQRSPMGQFSRTALRCERTLTINFAIFLRFGLAQLC